MKITDCKLEIKAESHRFFSICQVVEGRIPARIFQHTLDTQRSGWMHWHNVFWMSQQHLLDDYTSQSRVCPADYLKWIRVSKQFIQFVIFSFLRMRYSLFIKTISRPCFTVSPWLCCQIWKHFNKFNTDTSQNGQICRLGWNHWNKF